MKALITGMDGFVGEYLAEHLLFNNVEIAGTYLNNCGDVDSEIRDKIELFQLNILNEKNVKEILRKVNPDSIIHLAAQSSANVSWEKPQLTMDINLNGTINLLESIRELDLEPRVLLIGSSEEYGFIKTEDIPVDESQDLEPGNPYAVSKIAQNKIGKVYSRGYDMDIVMVRAFNHIGPKQRSTFVAADFAKRIAEMEINRKKTELMVGNLEAKRDFTDVRDIVKAYYQLLLKGEKGELYNVGSGNSYNIQYLLDILLSLATIDIEIRKDPKRLRPSDVPIVECDNTKLSQLTDWEPKFKLEDTLKDILDFWREKVSKKDNKGKNFK